MVTLNTNPTRMRRNPPHGYVDFWFWVMWPIACVTLEIVRRETSILNKIQQWKTGSYSTMHASVHENESWNNILNARSSLRCHLQKVAYLRCSCLVLSASSHLYWKRSMLVGSGLRDYKQSVMPTNHLHLWSVIVIKCVEFDRWPHIISTSAILKGSCLLEDASQIALQMSFPTGYAACHNSERWKDCQY